MPPPIRAFSRPVRDGGCVAAFACAARGATHNLRLSQRREIHRIGTRTIASSLTSRVMRDVTSFVRSPAEPCLSKQLRPATKAHLTCRGTSLLGPLSPPFRSDHCHASTRYAQIPMLPVPVGGLEVWRGEDPTYICPLEVLCPKDGSTPPGPLRHTYEVPGHDGAP